MSDARDEAVLNRWQRKLDRNEANHTAAKDGLKKFFKAAFKEEGTRQNIIREARDAARQGSGNTLKNREGFGNDDEIITGFVGDRPWERDIE